jgi:hypothetical protein
MPPAVISPAGKAMAMACWALTASSAHTTTVAASRTKPAAVYQTSRRTRVKQILLGCCQIGSPPMYVFSLAA